MSSTPDESVLRNALILGGIGLACAAVAYLLLDGTAVGQAWSDQAYLGSSLQPDYVRRLQTRWLHLITPITTGLMCLVLIGIGIVRRVWLVGFIAAVGLGLATLISEVLRQVLPHPDLATGYGALMDGKTYQTFPSGHATIATASTLGLLLVSGSSWRTPVAIVGTFATTLVAAGTVAATWHRPTDALGGIAIAFAVFSLAAWIAVRWCGHQRIVPKRRRLRTSGCAIAGAAGALVFLWSIEMVRASQLPTGVQAWAFPSAMLIIGMMAATAIDAYTWLLRGIAFPAAKVPDSPM